MESVFSSLRPVHTRELAPETDSCNRFARGACWFDMREQNSGAKVLLRSIFFRKKIVGADDGALLRERVARACCGSKLPRVYRPLYCKSRIKFTIFLCGIVHV